MADPVAASPSGVRTECAVTPTRGQWPALDGLRAVAVLAVLAVHVGVLLPGGYLGVDIFFVLSGFLITSLLIGEWDKRGHVNFRNFYARRALRLLPALACILAASTLLAWLLYAAGGADGRAYAKSTFAAIPWVIGFTVNWVRALGFSSFLGLLGPTWSLSVEEQFYLLWPALFVVLMRRGFSRARLALYLSALSVAVMAYRAAMAGLGQGHDRIYFGTDTHCDGLLLGCAIAFWLAAGPSSRAHRVPRRLAGGMTWLAVAVLVTLFLTGNETGPRAPLEITASVLSSAVLIAGVALEATPAPIQRFLCARWARWIGRRSYGLYLWQYVIIVPALTFYGRWAATFPVGERHFVYAVLPDAMAAACFVAAQLSYRFVELPALRIKQRFRS